MDIYDTKIIFRILGDKFVIFFKNDIDYTKVKTPELLEDLNITIEKVDLIDKKITSYKNLLNTI
jgi:hypothetical protein